MESKGARGPSQPTVPANLTPLSSEDLQAWAPFLNQDRLRPGDVILSRSASLISSGIAVATMGSFSHAAIWLPLPASEGESRSGILAESTGDGVGYTPLQAVLIQEQLAATPALRLATSPIRLAVYRHPRLADGSVDYDVLTTKASALAAKYFGTDYSDLARLPNVTALPSAIRRSCALALGIVDRCHALRNRERLPGPFCSELVTEFLDAFGLTPFETRRDASSVSPNSLVQEDSELRVVPDAVIAGADIGATAKGYVLPQFLSREGMFRQARLMKQVEAFGEWSRVQNLEHTRFFIDEAFRQIRSGLDGRDRDYKQVLALVAQVKSIADVAAAGTLLLSSSRLNALTDECLMLKQFSETVSAADSEIVKTMAEIVTIAQGGDVVGAVDELWQRIAEWQGAARVFSAARLELSYHINRALSLKRARWLRAEARTSGYLRRCRLLQRRRRLLMVYKRTRREAVESIQASRQLFRF